MFRSPFSGLFLVVVAAGSGVALAPMRAPAQFVPYDRQISDRNTSINDPAIDTLGNFLIWQDKSYNVWLATLDPITANLSPQDGMGLLLDPSGANPSTVGNTAKFAGGNGFSEAVWTHNQAGTLSLGEATQDASQAWNVSNVTNALNRSKPEGTHPNWVGPAKDFYNYVHNGQWLVGSREVGNAASEQTVGGVVPGIGGRPIEGQNSAMVAVADPNGTEQIASVDFNAATPTPVQITFGSQDTFNFYSWVAPEFNAPVISALVGSIPQGQALQIGLFRQTGPNTWENFYTITSPSPGYPYFATVKAFVANGTSYLSFVVMSQPGGGRFPFQPNAPSQVWIAGINPAQPFFRRVDNPAVPALKAEPHVFYTAAGPQLIFQAKATNQSPNWVLHAADTGVGTDWHYDTQVYAGPWAGPYRDNKNCSCTPFAVGDAYQEVTTFPVLSNRQFGQQLMGPEGHIYANVEASSGSSIIGYDPGSAGEVFNVDASAVGYDLFGNALIAANGDVLVAGKQLARYTNSGTQLWSAPLQGLTNTVQFAPDGNVMAFTGAAAKGDVNEFKGGAWFQVFSPDTGQLLDQQFIAAGRLFQSAPRCKTPGCATMGSPAVDPLGSRIYLSETAPNGQSLVRCFAYNSQTHTISLTWQSAPLAGSVGSPVLSSDYTRLYVQTQNGMLYAFDTSTGAVIWSFNLGVSALGSPTVTDFGYIMPGMRQSDSPTVNYVGILQDNGSSASWAYQTTDFAADSLAAVGRQNRFVLIAKRASDNALVLLVVSPKFGVMSQTQMTIAPLPPRIDGMVIDQNGWVYASTWGSSVYRAFSPTYETTVP